MNEIIEFIKENYRLIIGIVITVFILLVLINVKGINFNTIKPETHLVQQVTVETYSSLSNSPKSLDDSQENIDKMKLNPSESLCESYLGNSQELEGACNLLTETNCAETKCCVYLNNKCVAGGLDGPTFRTDKQGNLITLDTYYYLGKCQGKCNK